MRRLFYKLLVLLQAPRIYRFLNRDKITIITYHGFTDREDFTGIENDQGMHLHVSAFRKHIAYLASMYNVIHMEDVLAHYQTGKKLPSHPAVITIDDGYRSTYTLAYPVLKEFKVPASVFIATDFVGSQKPLWYDRVQYAVGATKEGTINLTVNGAPLVLKLHDDVDRLNSVKKLRNALKAMDQDQLPSVVADLERKSGAALHFDGSEPAIYTPLSWEQVAEMVQSGLVSVGSHTESHLILSRCSPERITQELLCSKQIIEENVGGKCDTFCYPNGTERDFDANTRQHLEDIGYGCGLTTVAGTNDNQSGVMELKRFSVPEDLAEFAVTISGVKLLLARCKKQFLGE